MTISLDIFGLNEIKKGVEDANAKLDILLAKPQQISPELEKAIKGVLAKSSSIDNKVPDLTTNQQI